jgi:hypothetical protein
MASRGVETLLHDLHRFGFGVRLQAAEAARFRVLIVLRRRQYPMMRALWCALRVLRQSPRSS